MKGFDVALNSLLGDGVNAPDVPPQEVFPYVHYAYSGRDSRHISAGDPTGCGDQPTSTVRKSPTRAWKPGRGTKSLPGRLSGHFTLPRSSARQPLRRTPLSKLFE